MWDPLTDMAGIVDNKTMYFSKKNSLKPGKPFGVCYERNSCSGKSWMFECAQAEIMRELREQWPKARVFPESQIQLCLRGEESCPVFVEGLHDTSPCESDSKPSDDETLSDEDTLSDISSDSKLSDDETLSDEDTLSDISSAVHDGQSEKDSRDETRSSSDSL
jgi:hypothetical protein